jgi:mannose-6-phosphate isomerase-like protein (cupin superfamily)
VGESVRCHPGDASRTVSPRQPAALLRAGEGEVISDRTARTVMIKAGLPSLAMTHSRFSAGQEGTDLHVHEKHDDFWWILTGELTFDLGAGDDMVTEVAHAGDFVIVPSMVPHGFRNDSDAEVTFLNPHAPGAGFDDYMRALRDGRRRAAEKFDQWPVPDEGVRPASDATIVRAGEGQVIDLGPSAQSLIKCGGGDGLGALTVLELTVQPGFAGPLPHTHKELTDGFHVLDGRLDLRVGDEWTTAGPGDYAVVPPGNVHTFANKGDEPVRVLNIIAPGGFEQYLVEVAAELLPGAAPDPARMAEIAARYDFETVA